jgi:protein-tyrosine phosphatase
MPSVLFVCTANVCRSPMAMAIFRNLVQGDQEDWEVASAGTLAIEGLPVASKALFVLRSKGLDISDHRSQPVTQELIDRFDLILTMEKNQKEALTVEFPKKAKRIYLFSEMIGLVYDVPDPVGKSLVNFQNTYNEIEQTLTMGLRKIRRLVLG